MKKTKIGIIMNSLECNTYLYDIINHLHSEPKIEIFLLFNLYEEDNRNFIYRLINMLSEFGMKNFLDYFFFSVMAHFEKRFIIKLLGNQTLSQHQKVFKINPDIFLKQVTIKPVFSQGKKTKRKIFVSYSEGDIKKIKALDLDIILRGNASGIYQGGILTSSKKGIISFHHGDNRWNRGGPPGFWEIYFKKPSTGFIIQILSESLDDGDVLFRGENTTFFIYTANLIKLYQYSYPFMSRLLLEFGRTGALPEVLPKQPFPYRILTTPGILTASTVFLSAWIRLFLKIIKGRVSTVRQRWSVAFVQTNWMTANLAKAMIVKNPKGRFLADPFVKKKDDQIAIFVEDYHYSLNKGVISAIAIQEDGSYEILPNIINEDFHLSFPYIFEYESNLYMIPESYESNAIRLYKCNSFPDKWEYQYNIMNNVNAVDSMIFEYGGKWWLLSNISYNSLNNYYSLFAFTAESPLSRDWHPHKKNPILISTECGRNGGLLSDNNGGIFRVRQKYSFNQYGSAFTIAKIRDLDPDTFAEDFYCEVKPEFLPNLDGIHHMHCDGDITVFDFLQKDDLT